MMTIRKKTKGFIILLIIALSVFAAIKFTGFQTQAPKEAIINTREADLIFNKANHYQKAVFQYTVNDLDLVKGKIGSLLSENKDSIRSIYYLDSNGVVSVLEIKKNHIDAILQKLREIEGLGSEKRESSQILPVTMIDVQSHITQNRQSLKRLQERQQSQHLSAREIGEVDQQIRNVQTKIDSLNNLQSVEENKNNLLAKITVKKVTQPSKSNTKIYLNLAIWIAIFIVAFTIALIIILFVYRIIGQIMSALGIRSKTHGSRYGYGYGYTYQSRSRASRKRRKVIDEISSKEKKKD